ncbi:MAG: hypothetical protein A3J80_04740 [Desulfobacula sp. RIFOXYB2_FULL_45_6]|nr:MAG: hypothetical protein A3J80_04740 [Desulfobacula sp. RIFOXYB2_FULL_45_6]
MNKIIKPNRYKPEPSEPSRFYADLGAGIDVCLKLTMLVAFFSILSLAAIFVYDFVTQAEFFNIARIEIIGTTHITREEILLLSDLNRDRNIYELNTALAEKRIASHPWIQSVSIKRRLDSKLDISVREQTALAIVRILNTDILINSEGTPFKEYNPATDLLEKNLPVISGLDLKKIRDEYLFAGTLFDSVMDFLKTEGSGSVGQIEGNENTGVTIETKNFMNPVAAVDEKTIPIKLGFDNYKAKLKKAKKICEYIDKNFPQRTISAMDLFNIEKVFIKTKLNDTSHNTLKKGA